MHFGVDSYHPGGRWTLDLFRTLRMDWHAGPLETDEDGIADVIYGIRFETLGFKDDWELLWSVSPMIDPNRNVVKGNHVFNLNAGVAVRGLPW